MAQSVLLSSCFLLYGPANAIPILAYSRFILIAQRFGTPSVVYLLLYDDISMSRCCTDGYTAFPPQCRRLWLSTFLFRLIAFITNLCLSWSLHPLECPLSRQQEFRDSFLGTVTMPC
eukprot:473057-Rhodomonas_salina.5